MITITAYKNGQKVKFTAKPTDGSFHYSVCSQEIGMACAILHKQGWEVYRDGWKVFVEVDEVKTEAEVTGEYKEITQKKAEAMIPAHIRNVRAQQPLTRAEMKAFGLI